MDSARFVRHYWGHPCWFLFLRLAICLSSPGGPVRSEVAASAALGRLENSGRDPGLRPDLLGAFASRRRCERRSTARRPRSVGVPRPVRFLETVPSFVGPLARGIRRGALRSPRPSGGVRSAWGAARVRRSDGRAFGRGPRALFAFECRRFTWSCYSRRIARFAASFVDGGSEVSLVKGRVENFGSSAGCPVDSRKFPWRTPGGPGHGP